uniref:Uncharacterized protein n=1 Tax=Clastoptera arizonana TaxID=38151 RepID=A0A1B6DWH9_9HEMI
MEGYPVMQVVEYRVPPPRLTFNPGVRKYVVLCTVCGGLASILGVFFLTVYLTLRTYTSSLDYFETIPTYIPAAMLMMTGLSVMCLARRKNRYVFLIKLCGIFCLLCAGTCVLVTVTTTVLHMSRLQSLRECVYTLKTQTCTCYSVLLESASERTDEGTRYVFSSTPDCEVIHGALYSCLRALFGISVTGILVCIFCCMLVYQLLSHERKKMYWEQLELRCRYLYGQAPTQMQNTPNVLPNTQTTQHCACCQQFRYQQDVIAWESSNNRFWTPGHVGNLYSPNPVGEECNLATSTPSRTSSGWSWRRLPWSRQSGDPVSHSAISQQRDSGGYHRPLNCSSPDSQYGFSVSQNGGIATVSTRTASYTMIDPVTQLNPPGCQVYQWGPPPPYSNPNSPSRRPLCPPGPHHHHCDGGVRAGKESRQGDNYVNANIDAEEAAGDEGSSSVFSNDDSCLALTLRIPSRKTDIPPSSSTSSVKSNPNPNSVGGECSHHQRSCVRQEIKSFPKRDDNINIGNCKGCRVSPRLKHLQVKPQSQIENPMRKQVQELTESEVYFADVSSCCNVSVKNDSMSIYDEALGMKPGHNGERVISLSNMPQTYHQHNHHLEHIKKQPRFVHSSEIKLESLQMSDKSEGAQKRSECHQIPEEVLGFQRVSSPECFCTEMGMDGSEEDDPELVSFSRQRQTSLRNRMPAFHTIDENKSCDTRNLCNPRLEDHGDFPSPMSVSSPSTTKKGNIGFYAEAVNSENGSSESVWMGYSPDFLAPDAQYETIPEHRLLSSEDSNGNLKESNDNRGNIKALSSIKRKIHLQAVGESWPNSDSNFNGSIQDFSEEKQKYSEQNINFSKDLDKSRGMNLNSLRRNEKRLGNIINSPKAVGRCSKTNNFQKIPEVLERRRGEMLNTGRICEKVDVNQCCAKIEDSKNSELLNYSRAYDQMCDTNPEKQNSVSIFERCRDVLNNPIKHSGRACTVSTNLINSHESIENQCCHSDNNCRGYIVEGNDQSEIRSVDV